MSSFVAGQILCKIKQFSAKSALLLLVSLVNHRMQVEFILQMLKTDSLHRNQLVTCMISKVQCITYLDTESLPTPFLKAWIRP